MGLFSSLGLKHYSFRVLLVICFLLCYNICGINNFIWNMQTLGWNIFSVFPCKKKSWKHELIGCFIVLTFILPENRRRPNLQNNNGRQDDWETRAAVRFCCDLKSYYLTDSSWTPQQIYIVCTIHLLWQLHALYFKEDGSGPALLQSQAVG